MLSLFAVFTTATVILTAIVLPRILKALSGAGGLPRDRQQPIVKSGKYYTKLFLTPSVIWRLFQLCKGNYTGLALCYFISFATTYTASVTPLGFSKCLDALQDENPEEKLYQRAKEFILLNITSALLACIQGFLTQKIDCSVELTVRKSLLEDLLSKDLHFFEDKNSQAELLTDIYTNFYFAVKYASLQPYFSFLQNLFQFGLGITILFSTSVKLSICLLIVTPLVEFISKYFSSYSSALSSESNQNQVDRYTLLDESITNIRLVKAFSTEERCIRKMNENCEQSSRTSLRIELLNGVLGCFTALANNFGEVLLVLVGGKMVLNGEIKVGDIAMFLLYAKQVVLYISNLGSFFSDFTYNGVYVDRVLEILNYVSKINAKGGEKPATCEGRIEFRKVGFQYPSREGAEALKNVNFEILPGDIVAFAGPSGSGKSTIISLLNRFYDPSEGAILIDGIDLKKLDLPWYHQRVGYVSQEPLLMPGTIRENIAYGVETYTEQQMELVCELANVKEFVTDKDAFPKGIETDVGDGGLKLSVGQKQRVAIARALIKDPVILIFDEATSALDAESEAQVQKAIDRLMKEKKCTMIIIAHRLSTIINSKRIYAMKGGEIHEVGTHQQLMSQKGLYKELFEKQLAGYEGQIVC